MRTARSIPCSSGGGPRKEVSTSPTIDRPPGTRQPPGMQTPSGDLLTRHAGIANLQCMLGYHPPVNRITHMCKNITLPQTSIAGGNKKYQSSRMCTIWVSFTSIGCYGHAWLGWGTIMWQGGGRTCVAGGVSWQFGVHGGGMHAPPWSRFDRMCVTRCKRDPVYNTRCYATASHSTTFRKATIEVVPV